MTTPKRQHKDPASILDQVRQQLARFELLQHLENDLASANDLSRQVGIQQNRAALAREINAIHPADIAFVLENLPLDQRLLIWELVKPEFDGAVLLEVSDAVRRTLIGDMDASEIVDAADHLDSDELADLVPDLPRTMVATLLKSLDKDKREQLSTALTFPEDTVGALMDFDFVAIRADVTLDVVLRFMRSRSDLADNIEELMVVDRDGQLRGTLPLRSLLRRAGDTRVEQIMNSLPVTFQTNDAIEDAVSSFERYDLLIAPVVNLQKQLVGILHIDEIVEYMHDSRQAEILSHVGVADEEDLFAPVWQSARNRGLWLALNLVTAFIASRIIAEFADTIEQLVILAALMPIVAAVGGNAGNQTLALVIRSIALNQIDQANFRHLISKEATVGLISGLLWGSVIALATYVFYDDGRVAVILLISMTLTLTLAAVVGVLTPALLKRAGFDPAFGSSVILTGITDSLGFFIFLGLAAMTLSL